MQYTAAAGTAGLYVALVYPQLWGLKRYREMLQMYRDGEPQPVDPDSQRMGQKVLDTVMWDPVSEANVEFFTAYGQDIVHRGSTFSSYGAIIGVPISFTYRSADDVDKEKITLNNQSIDWNTPAGKQLLESMILSEKAREFAIARELFYLHTYHIHVRGLLFCSCCFASYWMGAAINAVYRLTQRTPVIVRASVFGLIAGVGATVYCLASDAYSWYIDRKVDRQAAALGCEYAEGGVEFYTKLLQRNIALRSLMGPDGGKKYTAYGNDIHFWRSPCVPLTTRRDDLLEAVKRFEKTSEPKSVASAAQPA
ncbi:hypothetical protein BaRGS_00015551 [Batillaria attramentaria]|uniref:Transmembrane protein 177 n=1 Tax=Batillaria attramentaria TaxID=370345 RepID=A0ABD0L142_9CAEN